ncbi:MAG: hypothetical protein K0R88_1726 [Solirubrobacterales bacterium]|nr:hypothetical protein [Solirubrobacterales bacterium]
MGTSPVVFSRASDGEVTALQPRSQSDVRQMRPNVRNPRPCVTRALLAHSPSSGITVAALGNTSAEGNPLKHSTYDRYALGGLAFELLKPLSGD